MASELTWYFAYGSNMQRATFRERRALAPADFRVGHLDGYALSFDIPIGSGRRGVANLLPTDGAKVWGVLYLLSPEQHAHLDRTEGVHSGVYRRVLVPIQIATGETVETVQAETYVSDLRDPTRLPSYRYRTIIVEGAREHGLPQAYIDALENWSLAWDEREGALNPPVLQSPEAER